ncbi:TetR/AcrR family transcriptional regulator [Alkalihalobacillus sp. BA299]|uniref:TetR/AcrR family transcriptional regulator n=1 Tax=Alkalihalobacillus sp. BA299 TaxID=2815938 RepID=UPI001ADB12C0|nr:TetR/AcrR family transcriptional regulator [Alkalihalobacillus sp. BA299]
MNSRQIKAVETKNALYTSAIKLFKEKGYENVHVEEIAEFAGTSKGSFYTYFKSKDGVVIEHYNKIDQSYENALNILPENTPAVKKLVTVLNAGFQFSDDLGYEFLSLVLTNQLSLKETESLVVGKNRKLYKVVYSIIEKGKKTGEFDINEPIESLVEMTLTFYRGLFLDYCLMKNPNIKLSNYGEVRMKTFIEKMFFN